jgi:hypothetical protein
MTAHRRRLPRWCALRLATVEQSSLTVSNGSRKNADRSHATPPPRVSRGHHSVPSGGDRPKLNGFAFS